METTCLVKDSLSMELQRKDETFSEYVLRLKDQFNELMNQYSPFALNGKKVVFSLYGKTNWDGLFYHLATGYLPNNHGRTLNRERLKRVLWFPKILLNNTCYFCSYFHRAISLTKNKRIVFFCDNYNYVIACKEKDNYIIVITGYPVNRSVTFKYK